jgi:hypothetical protein
MMIETMSRNQMEAIYASWLTLTEARDEARRENRGAFDAGREWAAARDFDTVLAAVEFFTWNLAVRGARSHGLHIWQEDEASEMLHHFGRALDAEIGNDEGKRIAAMDPLSDNAVNWMHYHRVMYFKRPQVRFIVGSPTTQKPGTLV